MDRPSAATDASLRRGHGDILRTETCSSLVEKGLLVSNGSRLEKA